MLLRSVQGESPLFESWYAPRILPFTSVNAPRVKKRWRTRLESVKRLTTDAWRGLRQTRRRRRYDCTWVQLPGKHDASPSAQKKGKVDDGGNPKAFTYKSAVRAARSLRRTLDREAKRQHVPVVDHSALEPPPVCVAVVGPPKVGKSTLIQCLVKNYTRQNISDIQGPITIVSGVCVCCSP